MEAEEDVKRVDDESGHNLREAITKSRGQGAEKREPRNRIFRSREADEQPDRAPNTAENQIDETARECIRALSDGEHWLQLRAIADE